MEEGRASGVGVREQRASRGDCAAPEVTLTCATTTWMRGTVIESERAVEGGSVTELGGYLLVGRWSRVSEMAFLVRDFG